MRKIKIFNFIIVGLALSLVIVATLIVNNVFAQAASPEAASQPPLVLIAGFASAALAVGLSCIGAAYAVSNIGVAAMGAISEKPELAGRALIFAGLAEGIAIYGLIVAIMILGKL